VRLRQAVLVAADLDGAVTQLTSELGLGEPFNDPGVAEFGLVNAVFALEDCFLEVIAPARPETAAGRHLERHGGDGGYMLIFDLEELAPARDRADELGVRVVWQIDLPDISGTHLHPGDMRGTIVSLDRSDPYGSWRWGGPDWTARIGSGAPVRLVGATIAVADPAAVAERWGAVLGREPGGGAEPVLELDGARIVFRRSGEEPEPGLVEVALEVAPELRAGREAIEMGALRLQLLDAVPA
jgi:hypothetical protein